MYRVFSDGNLIFDPNMVGSGYAIYNPEITFEDNRIGSFKFNLPPVNPMYNNINKLTSVVKVYDDGNEIFEGRVLEDKKDFYNNKEIYCEGCLGYLVDSVIRPQPFSGLTIEQFLQSIISQHNSQMPSNKHFSVGTVTVTSEESLTFDFKGYDSTWNMINNYLIGPHEGHILVRKQNGIRYIDYLKDYSQINSQVIHFSENMLDLSQVTNGDEIFTELIPLGTSHTEEKEDNEIVVGGLVFESVSDDISPRSGSDSLVFDLKLKIIQNSKSKANRTSNVTMTLGIRAKTGSVSWSGLSSSKIYARLLVGGKQKQKTGVTSLSLTPSETWTDICTWTGNISNKEIKVTGEFVNKYSAKDSKPKSGATSGTLDMEEINKKTIYATIESVNDGSDTLINQEAENIFGKIVKVNQWPDILDPGLLKEKATKFLSEHTNLVINLEVKAVDLSMIDGQYSRINLGEKVRVISRPHNLDEYFECKKVVINLENPGNNTYGLGKELKSLTEHTVSTASSNVIIGDTIENVVSNLTETDNMVEAINNAVQQIYNDVADIFARYDSLEADYADIEFANIGTAAINNLFSNSATISYLSARYATIESLQAVEADIGSLETNKLDADAANITQAFIDTLQAGTATVTGLDATYATIANLNAANANITALQTGKLDANLANITTAAIQSLFANTATINALNAAYLRVDATNITQATIDTLKAGTATIDGLDASYADIDLANISQAGIERMFVDTALLTNVTIEDGVVTGVLNGVEIHGDLITGGTIAADKLVIRGEDGLYYQLNVTGSEVSAEHINEEQYKNKLDGTAIVAKSLTANQIAAHTITGSEIMAESITANELSSGAVTTDKLAANAVTANKIETGAITSDKIAANAITFSLLESSVQDDLNDANTLAQHIKIANGEITITAEDENSNEEFKMRLAARNLRFIENTNTLTAWLAGRQEGLGAAMISVGPPDEINEDGSTDASKIDKRWRISVSDDGTRFRISRHEENVE